MKTCKQCNKIKALSEFYSHPNTRDGLTTKCKECVKAQSRAWAKAHPTRHAFLQARSDAVRRNLAPPDEASYAEAKLSACVLCGETRRLQHDHSHISGKFRGMLCGSCNRRLPDIEQHEQWYVRALNYLWGRS